MAKSIRVQGKDFRDIRHLLKYRHYILSTAGNIRVNMRHKITGRFYHKWLNEDEQERFKLSEEYAKGPRKYSYRREK